jgi:hypothetical protein
MSEQAATPDPSERGLPCQMDVYFTDYPGLDLPALARFVDEREPGEFEACEVRAVGDGDAPNEEGLRVAAFSAFQGPMGIAALVHNTSTPAIEVIEHAAVLGPVRQQLAAHRAWALLTLVGGDDLAPVERMLYLYKVAAGLCEQGGIGVGNLHTGRVFPGGLMRDLFGKSPESGETSIWDILRHHGEPIELLAHFGQVELLGKRYLATCGFGYCGLPDLVWEYTNARDTDDVTQMFKNCFTYMMEHGPVIQPGHTVGYDENVAFRFSEPPEGLELPYPNIGVLVMKKERARKK